MNKVLVAAVVGLAALSACGRENPPTTVASAGNVPNPTVTTGAADPVTTTSAPAASTTTVTTGTTASTAEASSTTTTARPTTTTTRPATTTTTRPAPHTVTVTPAPGPYATTVTVRGDGCAGPGYGVTLAIHDPSGQDIPGDGGAAQPDGTWELRESFNKAQPAGDYTFAASCITATSKVVFGYGAATFRWAG